MANKSWGIKLGSGGICVPFCESHSIVGLGWKMVNSNIISSSSKEALWQHVSNVCNYSDNRAIGSATGKLFRFAQECAIGDYIFYYDPPNKHVRICRVLSEPLYRNFDLNTDIDVWHYREVEYPLKPISILDFYGVLKGKLLGPRMSFWTIFGGTDYVAQLLSGRKPGAEQTKEYQDTMTVLKKLILKQVEVFADQDWEKVAADFLKSQGAQIDGRIGGNRSIIDVEARFDHGIFGEDIWRIQVKCYKDRKVDWPQIEKDFHHVGDAKFCYVAVFGFTDEARRQAEANGVLLLEAVDFVPFFMSGKLRSDLIYKLGLTA